MAVSKDMALLERKQALRQEMRARRMLLGADHRAAASRDIAWHVLRHLPWRERRRVSLFWPLAEELDTRPLLHSLFWLGAEPLLPRMQGKGQPLVFHRWSPDLTLVPGPLGVMEPPPGLPPVLPEIVLAPLLAFDQDGQRLGYGAGFYDRTFGAVVAAGGDPLRVGLCFACQQVPAVPVDAADVPLDLVITEEGPLQPQPAEGRPLPA
jgi:5-formyltetrahydrofolate cyclo-ligase